MSDEDTKPNIWYFFVGAKGISFGKWKKESKPVYSQGMETANVILSKPFRGLFDFNDEQIIPRMDFSKHYNLPLIMNGNRIGIAKVFLHDYWGNQLAGVIPASTSFTIDNLKNTLIEKNARISSLTSTNLKLLADHAREKKQWMAEMKELNKAGTPNIIPKK